MNLFKSILCVTETIKGVNSAIESAVAMAEINQAELTIIDILPAFMNSFKKETIDNHLKLLDSMIEPYRQRVKIEIEVQIGPVFLEAIRAVLRKSHDLVIKEAENPDFMARLFGSDDIHLLRKCPCPVWIMKSTQQSNENCIMAAVDFDPLLYSPADEELNRKILQIASSLAISKSASLHIVHAWQPFPESIMLSRSDNNPGYVSSYIEKERALHQKGINLLREILKKMISIENYKSIIPCFHLPKGDPKQKIAEMASNLKADIVVMGTVARTGISGFIIGNTAEAVLSQLDCSVVAVKPLGFVTPVKINE